MPKAANAPLKPVHVPNPRPVKVVPIKHPDRQNGPHHTGRAASGNVPDTKPSDRGNMN